jgi:hypothetical protein
MTERRKSPNNSSPWFVEALFQLPLSARQALVTKYDLPISTEDLVLPSDEKQIDQMQTLEKQQGEKQQVKKQIAVQLANTIAIEGNVPATPDENLAATTEVTTTILSSTDELEADALRALMGYGRLARQKDESHDC